MPRRKSTSGDDALAVAAHFAEPKCPYCQHHIPKGSNPCPRCGSYLYW